MKSLNDQATQSLRIALFTYSVKPRGGVIHTLALAEHLQARGHAVHIFALGKDQTGFFRPTTVPFTLIPIGNLPDEVELDVRIAHYIQTYYEWMLTNTSKPFDIYHVQDCVSANAIWRVREDQRIHSFVRTVHHVDDFTSPALIRCQNDSIYRPDQRIVVSRHWQERLQSEFGVASAVIYNGVDLQRFHPPTAAQRAAARATLHIDDEFLIVNIGGVEPRKNTIRLLKAFESVKHDLERRGRTSVLMLAGGETLLDHTPYRREFEILLASSSLEAGKDLRLLGVIPDDQIPQLYHAADMLAFPSVKEGWGLVVLEALASELPVLASDLPVFREYLRSNENALLVDPHDEAAIAMGMLHLATQDHERRRLAAAGPATAQQFSWSTTAQKHEECYLRWLRPPVGT
ncbi:MAG: MSMEG_0565 family glycosyltransferase [Herpetosiphon sp.]